MIFCGIDPGLTGFLCLIDDVLPDDHADKALFFPAPVVEGRVDPAGIVDLVGAVAQSEPGMTVLERQQAMRGEDGRGQGVASTAVTMHGYGVWEGACMALLRRHAFRVVNAGDWRAGCGALGKNRSARLKASVARAKKFFPKVDLRATGKSRTDSHDKAAALLMAGYARALFRAWLAKSKPQTYEQRLASDPQDRHASPAVVACGNCGKLCLKGFACLSCSRGP